MRHATRERGPWPRRLWLAAAILFPITGFLVFAVADRFRRRDPVRRDAAPLGWKWVTAHLLLIALAIPAYAIARHKAIVHVDTREAVAAVEQITLAVQVQGKTRGTIQVAKEVSEDAALAAVMADAALAKFVTGPPKKVIVVPGRLVNIVL